MVGGCGWAGWGGGGGGNSQRCRLARDGRAQRLKPPSEAGLLPHESVCTHSVTPTETRAPFASVLNRSHAADPPPARTPPHPPPPHWGWLRHGTVYCGKCNRVTFMNLFISSVSDLPLPDVGVLQWNCSVEGL